MGALNQNPDGYPSGHLPVIGNRVAKRHQDPGEHHPINWSALGTLLTLLCFLITAYLDGKFFETIVMSTVVLGALSIAVFFFATVFVPKLTVFGPSTHPVFQVFFPAMVFSVLVVWMSLLSTSGETQTPGGVSDAFVAHFQESKFLLSTSDFLTLAPSLEQHLRPHIDKAEITLIIRGSASSRRVNPSYLYPHQSIINEPYFTYPDTTERSMTILKNSPVGNNERLSFLRAYHTKLAVMRTLEAWGIDPGRIHFKLQVMPAGVEPKVELAYTYGRTK